MHAGCSKVLSLVGFLNFLILPFTSTHFISIRLLYHSSVMRRKIESIPRYHNFHFHMFKSIVLMTNMETTLFVHFHLQTTGFKH